MNKSLTIGDNFEISYCDYTGEPEPCFELRVGPPIHLVTPENENDHASIYFTLSQAKKLVRTILNNRLGECQIVKDELKVDKLQLEIDFLIKDKDDEWHNSCIAILDRGDVTEQLIPFINHFLSETNQ